MSGIETQVETILEVGEEMEENNMGNLGTGGDEDHDSSDENEVVQLKRQVINLERKVDTLESELRLIRRKVRAMDSSSYGYDIISETVLRVLNDNSWNISKNTVLSDHSTTPGRYKQAYGREHLKRAAANKSINPSSAESTLQIKRERPSLQFQVQSIPSENDDDGENFDAFDPQENYSDEENYASKSVKREKQQKPKPKRTKKPKNSPAVRVIVSAADPDTKCATPTSFLSESHEERGPMTSDADVDALEGRPWVRALLPYFELDKGHVFDNAGNKEVTLWCIACTQGDISTPECLKGKGRYNFVRHLKRKHPEVYDHYLGTDCITIKD